VLVVRGLPTWGYRLVRGALTRPAQRAGRPGCKEAPSARRDGSLQHRQLDLNSASQELAGLPGITDEDAARIVAKRPYGSKRDLLGKSVLGERRYEQVHDYVYVSEARCTGGRHSDQN